MRKGTRWVVLYAPPLSREGTINYIVVPEGGFFLKKNNKSLIMQDAPERSLSHPKSHRKKVQARKMTFKVIFKALEALLMAVEVVKGLCEIFKR